MKVQLIKMSRKETWKDIDGFPDYQVSDQGRVRNKETGYILKPGLSGNGYYTVSLYKNNKGHTKHLHELIAEAFIGKREKGMTINHKDGDKTNNDLSNLEIVTYSDNLRHAYENGLNNHCKKVRIVETGEVFNSLKDCADAINGDNSNIVNCINGKLKSHKGLHFEYVDEKPKRAPFLYDYQMEAVEKVRNGSILCGSVGSGKSRTGLFYYFKENGGWIDEYGYKPMKNPQDLYIITTAKKRNSCEWSRELANFLMSDDPETNYYKGQTIVVDSWNNIGKYTDVKGAFFLLDEQRLVSYGSWTKSFLKIAKTNNWILLSATPGDSYMDYLPVFLANGFFKNKSEFTRNHVIYSRFSKYPKIDRYYNTQRLDRLRRRVLVNMNYKHKIDKHVEEVYCSYDVSLYKNVTRNRWDIYKDEPIRDAAGLCYILRRVVNSDESRQARLLEIMEEHSKAIIFYNFTYELEILRSIFENSEFKVGEYNGQKHQDVPHGDKWVYLCQYTAASEGWECIWTNVIIFYSQNYSYKMTTQAAGRIDRLNTPYTELYYYYLKSRSGIDLAISKALREKRNFNEGRFVKW